MGKYRKKPIVIEAFQMTEDKRYDNSDWPNWLNEAWNKEPKEEGCLFCVDNDGMIGPGKNLCITTLEGALAVTFGDYIIQGVQGELYPCKPDIFEESYEAILIHNPSRIGRVVLALISRLATSKWKHSYLWKKT